MNKRPELTAILMAGAASLLLLSSLWLPLWKMRMEAPQYRGEEALKVAVFPTRMQGDVRELATLNQYIGVHVPEKLPQFNWLGKSFVAAATLALVGIAVRGRFRTACHLSAAIGLGIALSAAALQARQQMFDIGHRRDPKAALRGVKDFTPPLIGKVKIANFSVSSAVGLGAWTAGAAIGLLLLSGRPSAFRNPRASTPELLPRTAQS